eukprot:995723-Pelagomonas_calceolata.AAC.1
MMGPGWDKCCGIESMHPCMHLYCPTRKDMMQFAVCLLRRMVAPKIHAPVEARASTAQRRQLHAYSCQALHGAGYTSTTAHMHTHTNTRTYTYARTR